MHDSRLGRCHARESMQGVPVERVRVPLLAIHSCEGERSTDEEPALRRVRQEPAHETADDLGRLRRGYWLSPCVSRELWFGCTVSLRWKRVCNKIES